MIEYFWKINRWNQYLCRFVVSSTNLCISVLQKTLPALLLYSMAAFDSLFQKLENIYETIYF